MYVSNTVKYFIYHTYKEYRLSRYLMPRQQIFVELFSFRLRPSITLWKSIGSVLEDPSTPQGGLWYFIHTVARVIFFGFKILNFNILGVFRKMNILEV